MVRRRLSDFRLWCLLAIALGLAAPVEISVFHQRTLMLDAPYLMGLPPAAVQAKIGPVLTRVRLRPGDMRRLPDGGYLFTCARPGQLCQLYCDVAGLIRGIRICRPYAAQLAEWSRCLQAYGLPTTTPADETAPGRLHWRSLANCEVYCERAGAGEAIGSLEIWQRKSIIVHATSL